MGQSSESKVERIEWWYNWNGHALSLIAQPHPTDAITILPGSYLKALDS